MVRGPWITRGYFKEAKPNVTEDGWFPTGDVATIDTDGFMSITDRSKDVIKSGGEWISSIDLENEAMGHPAVQEACVISVPHSRWLERPLLLLVLKPNAKPVSRADVLEFLARRVVKWWLPDDVLFVKELPHTATGKLQKLALREKYRTYQLPTDRGDAGQRPRSKL